MKVGDLVTWKQREDLKESSCPWRRLGIVVAIERGRPKDLPDRCEVHWYDSGNKVWWAQNELERAR